MLTHRDSRRLRACQSRNAHAQRPGKPVALARRTRGAPKHTSSTPLAVRRAGRCGPRGLRATRLPRWHAVYAVTVGKLQVRRTLALTGRSEHREPRAGALRSWTAGSDSSRRYRSSSRVRCTRMRQTGSPRRGAYLSTRGSGRSTGAPPRDMPLKSLPTIARNARYSHPVARTSRPACPSASRKLSPPKTCLPDALWAIQGFEPSPSRASPHRFQAPSEPRRPRISCESAA